jgi:hypothetical protein
LGTDWEKGIRDWMSRDWVRGIEGIGGKCDDYTVYYMPNAMNIVTRCILQTSSAFHGVTFQHAGTRRVYRQLGREACGMTKVR